MLLTVLHLYCITFIVLAFSCGLSGRALSSILVTDVILKSYPKGSSILKSLRQLLFSNLQLKISTFLLKSM